MKHFCISLLLCLASVGLANAAMADKYSVPFSISPGCGQVGTEPEGLSSDLPIGYDYSCYEPGPYIARWSTSGGIDASAFLGEDADLVGSLVDYLMDIVGIAGPILAFGIISVLSCCFWSCGMLQCCAGANGKKRCCCGICCANPPKFTEGKCEWILMLVTLFMAVVVLGLSFQGLVINNVQNEAVEKMANAVGLLETWMNSTVGRIESTTNTFTLVTDEVDTLKTVLASMSTDSIRAEAENAAVELNDAMAGASEQIIEVNATIGTLTGSIGEMSGMFETVSDFNSYRHTGLMAVWVTLAILMLWELLVAFFRQWQPECTNKTCVKCIFSLVTTVYLLVLFILFLVLTVVAVVTVMFGDICTNPDVSIIGIIGGLVPSDGVAAGASDAVATTTTAGASALGGLVVGPGLMTYFIDCDTNDNITNTFNGISLEVFGMMDEGTGQIASMKTLFEEKEPELEKVYDEAKAANEDGTVSDADFAEAQKTWDDFNSDKATIFEQIAVVEGQVTALLEVIRGTADSDEDAAAAGEAGDSAARHRQRRAVSDAEPDAQGMEKGLFSVVQCYQVNARYQAVVNLLCSQFFDTIAMTVEYLLVAGVFMVIVEFCKRWMRPYNQALEKTNQVSPISGDERWDLAKGRKSKSGSNNV